MGLGLCGKPARRAVSHTFNVITRERTAILTKMELKYLELKRLKFIGIRYESMAT